MEGTIVTTMEALLGSERAAGFATIVWYGMPAVGFNEHPPA